MASNVEPAVLQFPEPVGLELGVRWEQAQSGMTVREAAAGFVVRDLKIVEFCEEPRRVPEYRVPNPPDSRKQMV
jgi:hypothetical protein